MTSVFYKLPLAAGNRLGVAGTEARTTVQVRLGGAWMRMVGRRVPWPGVGGFPSPHI